MSDVLYVFQIIHGKRARFTADIPRPNTASSLTHLASICSYQLFQRTRDAVARHPSPYWSWQSYHTLDQYKREVLTFLRSEAADCHGKSPSTPQFYHHFDEATVASILNWCKIQTRFERDSMGALLLKVCWLPSCNEIYLTYIARVQFAHRLRNYHWLWYL